jgi:hypothetical protein
MAFKRLRVAWSISSVLLFGFLAAAFFTFSRLSETAQNSIFKLVPLLSLSEKQPME